MAGNNLVLAGGQFQRPAHLQTAFADQPSNMKVMSVRVPTLSMQGKCFTISADGKDARVEREIDGVRVVIPVLPIIILGFNAQRGRAYYKGTFDPKNVTPPTCWSKDGITPDDSVPEKQSPTCAGCEWKVKGSRVSDNNKPIAACQEHRLLSVIPYKALHSQMPPLRFRLPPTSDYDGQNKEAIAQGKLAFSQYIDHLRTRGVSHSFEVVTKMSFDQSPGVNFPKVFFEPADWILAEDAPRITELRESPIYADCLQASEADVIAGNEGEQSPATRSARADPSTARSTGNGGSAPVADPQAAAKAAAEAAQRQKAAAEEKARQEAAVKAEKDRKAAEQRAQQEAAAREAAEREAAQKAAANGGAGVTMDLGDVGDLGDAGSLGGGAAATTAAPATIDPKNPPSQVPHVEDTDVDDIMGRWSGD